jgi:hypothetical protein
MEKTKYERLNKTVNRVLRIKRFNVSVAERKLKIQFSFYLEKNY